MSLLGRIALLFVAVPLVELVLLIQVGQWVGVWPTIGLVFLTGILGALLAKAEGVRTLWAFRMELARGSLPTRPIQDGVAILVGGALLLTPGLLTDVAGFALLLPPTRHLIQKAVRRRLGRMIQDGTVRVVTDSSIFGGRWGAPHPQEEAGRDDAHDLDPHDGEHDDRDRTLDPDKEIRG